MAIVTSPSPGFTYNASASIIDHLQDVKRGLAAVILEGARSDFRKSIAGLCLLYNSARKLGLDPDRLLRRSAHAGTEKRREFIEGYIKIGKKNLRCLTSKKAPTKTESSSMSFFDEW